MKREGNEIVFDDESQRLRFEQQVSIGDDVDLLLGQVLEKICVMKSQAKRWWGRAQEFCEKDEQPVYHFDKQKLEIEKLAPKPPQNTDPKTVFYYLQEAKNAAVAEHKFELASEIRNLHDEWKRSSGTSVEFVDSEQAEKDWKELPK